MHIKEFLKTKQILDFFCYFVVFVSLAMVCTCILYNANWIFGDDWQIVATTAVNKFGLHGHYGGGRFWPLGLCDYNLLVFIKGGNTPFGHYLYNIIILVMFFITIFYLIKEIVKNNSLYYFTFFFIIFLITKDFIKIHIDVIYPERMMIFVLSIFMFFYFKALKSNEYSYYIIAFFSAFYLTYCKEPIFGVFILISSVNLFLKYKTMTCRELLFYIALIINSIIYFVLWYFFIFKQADGFYNLVYTSHLSVCELVYKIVIDKPIFILISGFVFVRAYMIIIKKDYDKLFYDSLLFAGIAYAGAFVYLNIIHSYYFLISLLLAFPSLVYWIDYGFKYDEKKLSSFFIFIVSALSLYNIDLTVKFIEYIHISRKEDIKIIEELEILRKAGKEIIFYEDSRNFVSCWYYKICDSFLKWRFKRDTNIPIINNLKEIKSNHAVLYPPFEERFKNKFEKVRFGKVSFYPIMDTKIGEVYVSAFP